MGEKKKLWKNWGATVEKYAYKLITRRIKLKYITKQSIIIIRAKNATYLFSFVQKEKRINVSGNTYRYIKRIHIYRKYTMHLLRTYVLYVFRRVKHTQKRVECEENIFENGWSVAWNSPNIERNSNGAAISVFLPGDSSSFVSVPGTVGGVCVMWDKTALVLRIQDCASARLESYP